MIISLLFWGCITAVIETISSTIDMKGITNISNAFVRVGVLYSVSIVSERWSLSVYGLSIGGYIICYVLPNIDPLVSLRVSDEC